MATGWQSKAFTIPAGSGDFDSEVLAMNVSTPRTDQFYLLALEVTGTPVASSSVTVDVLKPGAAGTVDGDFNLAVHTLTGASAGLTQFPIIGGKCRIRGKSGGTGGTLNVRAAYLGPGLELWL